MVMLPETEEAGLVKVAETLRSRAG
jgi:hypothetical protein